MKLEKYLQRIHYTGPRTATEETLRQLHRAHLLAIPYENLDIHLGRRLTLDTAHVYTKIIEQGRGGWCYEMNALFAWALRELGFDVTLLGSSVGKPAQGAGGDHEHLILQVQLAQPWLVDVGFGNGILEPLPLLPGHYRQGFLDFRLEEADANWFFHNHVHGGEGYGFTLLPRQLPEFATCCHELQTSPDSGFVKTTVCHRFTTNGFVSLRGLICKHYTATGVTAEEITTPARYRQVLQETFTLAPVLADTLWAQVWARHVEWKQAQASN
jgi:N-hydroxyarylamine O-acetyltransferase